jgi:hypothetical protein
MGINVFKLAPGGEKYKTTPVLNAVTAVFRHQGQGPMAGFAATPAGLRSEQPSPAVTAISSRK